MLLLVVLVAVYVDVISVGVVLTVAMELVAWSAAGPCGDLLSGMFGPEAYLWCFLFGNF